MISLCKGNVERKEQKMAAKAYTDLFISLKVLFFFLSDIVKFARPIVFILDEAYCAGTRWTYLRLHQQE
jgi:hypothetical protein